jgi:aromatic-amino-acid transaminase
MTRPAHLVPSRRGRPGDDPIFALNAEANTRRARGEAVINATLGALLDDTGALAVLPTAARAVREVTSAEWAPYAPIAGTASFLKAVIADVAGARRELAARAAAVATPGGSGALRHAIASFLEPGQALLTTSYYWGPYQTIADEHDRRVASFRMFDPSGAFDVASLDAEMTKLVATQGRVLLILNDPCQNPTGYSMSPADWKAVVDVISRHADAAPVSVVIDAAYSAFGPERGIRGPLAALEPVSDRALVLVAWTASKTFTHYGLRVGALVAFATAFSGRDELQAALTYACRGTWSNCNRGGMAAVTRLLTDPDLRTVIESERADLVTLLDARVAAFNGAARAAGLRFPRYDGGFFTTVFTDDADAAARRMREEAVYVVPIEGALRLGLCSVRAADVPRLVDTTARAVQTR